MHKYTVVLLLLSPSSSEYPYGGEEAMMGKGGD
jgi:hypothetical protein